MGLFCALLEQVDPEEGGIVGFPRLGKFSQALWVKSIGETQLVNCLKKSSSFSLANVHVAILD